MRVLAVLAAVLSLLLLAACGGGDDGASSGEPPARPPVLDRDATPESEEDDEEEAEAVTPATLGFPGFATKNTTRVAGADPVEDAAGAAVAVFPSASVDSRPLAVSLVDAEDWRSAISASQLMARPLRAPVLLTLDGELPGVTAAALEQLDPRGTRRTGDAQVVRVGPDAAPAGKAFKARAVGGKDAAAVARAVDRLASSAAGKPSRAVIVAPSEAPEFAMPAAGLAVKTGAPVLWTDADDLPPATSAAIKSRSKPDIYVIGPDEAVGPSVVKALRELGTVKRIAGEDPAANAIAVARFFDDGFGWGVIDPGHGLVFASTERPADAAAAAALSGSGSHGPLLLVTEAESLPAPLQGYLLDIQPGYDSDPVRGVYNHGWLMGDEDAISTAVQARIDSLLEIQPVDRSQ